MKISPKINSDMHYGIKMSFQIHGERINLLINKLAEDKKAATGRGREEVQSKIHRTPYNKFQLHLHVKINHKLFQHQILPTDLLWTKYCRGQKNPSSYNTFQCVENNKCCENKERQRRQ